MEIKPLGKRVLIKKTEKSQTTPLGIYIPSDDNQNIGDVIAKGKEVTEVEIGDRVIFSKYSATEIKDRSIEYIIVDSKDLLGIVKED